MQNQNNSNQYDQFHTLTIDDSISKLGSSLSGLSQEEAQLRLSKYGKNILQDQKSRTILRMLFEQFNSIMIYILIAAAIISAVLHEITDTIIILVVVVLNAILGILQESKAEKALKALKDMSSPYSKVKRNGVVNLIKAEDIVIGDIVQLEAGDIVPADMRLIECASLKIEEASLTGESVPVEKNCSEIYEESTVIGDRLNMAFMSSIVSYGRGTGIVTSTGMNTEVGKIAGYISSYENQKTPLQDKLEQLGKYISIGVVILSLLIFVVGIINGRNIFEMFLTAVSLAVAAIPEGLTAIVTIVLAIGVQKMAKRNAIIRTLPAVETLGSTEIICTDKTGTLTQNKMTVKKVYLDGKFTKSEDIDINSKSFKTFIQIMTLCNDSKVSATGEDRTILGDPTEVALINFASSRGYNKNKLDLNFPRINEIPFDSDRKLMTSVNKIENKTFILTKGAIDELLDKSNKILINGQVEKLSSEHIEDIKSVNKEMAEEALRVLSFAFRETGEIENHINPESTEKDLIFVGLIGMIDPPREEVKDAIKTCLTAGIRPVMITGDHKDTATAIALELGMISDRNQVISGNDLNNIKDEDFIRNVNDYSVYARVSPEHKVKIVKSWKENNKIVAMTGDGVNDAPALKTADIGVGMGITGTDVAKGVSDMVLGDDNFSTIVYAVKEGRRIYSNIRKSIQFLLSANLGEVFTLFIATMFNWPILLPIHILWINLITDTFPALALGMEKAEHDIMHQKPRKSTSNFFSGRLGTSIIYQGILEGVIALVTYFIGITYYSQSTATTMAFVTLGLIQLAHSFNVRSNTKSILKLGLFSNAFLIGATLISVFMQLIVVLVPALRKIFKLEQLDLNQWIIAIIASLCIIPIVEIVKFFQNRAKHDNIQL